MAVALNHTIVWCTQKAVSARFVTELFGLADPEPFGPFFVVDLANGVSMDYHECAGPIASQHYAFLITEDEFDTIFARIRAQELDFWADPACRGLGKIIIPTAVAACISTTPTATCSRSSPAPMRAAPPDRGPPSPPRRARDRRRPCSLRGGLARRCPRSRAHWGRG